MKDNRIAFIDYAKAIGIILVVVGHVFRGLAHDYVVPNYYYLKKIDSIIYTFHMPLFFFISGLFFYDSLIKKGALKLLLSKIDTIVYPYLLWRFIQGLPMVLLASYGIGHHQITYQILFEVWKPITQFWFLYDLFFMFVFSALVYSFLSRKITPWLFALTAILYIYQLDIKSLHIPFLYDFAKNYVYFVLGILLVDQVKNSKYFMLSILFTFTMLFFASQYWFHFNLDLNWEDKGLYTLILGFISIAFVILLSQQLSMKNRPWVNMIGKNSMAIYLMHVIFAAGTREILNKVFGITDFYIQFLFGIVVGVFVPILTIKLSEMVKFPYLQSAPLSKLISKT